MIYSPRSLNGPCLLLLHITFTSNNQSLSQTFQAHAYDVNMQHVIMVSCEDYVILDNVQTKYKLFPATVSSGYNKRNWIATRWNSTTHNFEGSRLCIAKAWLVRPVCSVECDGWASKICVALFGCTSRRRLSSNAWVGETVTWTHHLPNIIEWTLCHRLWSNGPEIGARTIWNHCARWKLHSRNICDILTAGGVPYRSHMRRNKTAEIIKSVKTSRVFFELTPAFDWMLSTLATVHLSLIIICITINDNTGLGDRVKAMDRLLTPGGHCLVGTLLQLICFWIFQRCM